MFTCVFCPKTKQAAKAIVHNIKEAAFKIIGSQRQERGNANIKNRDEGAAIIDVMEWEREIATGVFITLVPQPNGLNRIKRIKFSQEIFDEEAALRWWTQNYEKMIVLFNIERLHSSSSLSSSHSRVVDEISSISLDECPQVPPNFPELDSVSGRDSYKSTRTPSKGHSTEREETESSESPEIAASGDDARENDETELVEEDEPGVLVTVKVSRDNHHVIKRVELSRERFTSAKAKAWWIENQDRLYQKYT